MIVINPVAPTQNTLLTVQSMISLSGATTATFVVANAMQSAFDFNPRWLALAISEALAIFGAAYSHGGPTEFFVAIVNGALIYCTAVGITQIAARPRRRVMRGEMPDGESQPSAHRNFRSAWF